MFALVEIGGVVQAGNKPTPMIPGGVVSRFFARGASATGLKYIGMHKSTVLRPSSGSWMSVTMVPSWT